MIGLALTRHGTPHSGGGGGGSSRQEGEKAGEEENIRNPTKENSKYGGSALEGRRVA